MALRGPQHLAACQRRWGSGRGDGGKWADLPSRSLRLGSGVDWEAEKGEVNMFVT